MAHQSGRKGKEERAELHGVYLVTWQTSWILNRSRHLICGNKLQYKKVILKDCGALLRTFPFRLRNGPHTDRMGTCILPW
jgi:hypothetical protein